MALRCNYKELLLLLAKLGFSCSSKLHCGVFFSAKPTSRSRSVRLASRIDSRKLAPGDLPVGPLVFHDGHGIALVEHMGSSSIFTLQSKDSSIHGNPLNYPSTMSHAMSSAFRSLMYSGPNPLITPVANLTMTS